MVPLRQTVLQTVLGCSPGLLAGGCSLAPGLGLLERAGAFGQRGY